MFIFESFDVSVRCYGYLKVLEKIIKFKKGKCFWIYWMVSLVIQYSRFCLKNISGFKMGLCCFIWYNDYFMFYD